MRLDIVCFCCYLFILLFTFWFFILSVRSGIQFHGKNGFVEVSKYFTEYRSENNFVGK